MNLSDDDIVAHLGDLPASLPIVLALMADLRDDHGHLRELTQHLQRDPVLTGHVLSQANRAAHLLGGPAVDDVFTAASLIGLARIQRIVASSCILGITRDLGASRRFQVHSLAVSVCMQELAPRLGIQGPRALVTGLLHDIGSLLFQHLQDSDQASAGREGPPVHQLTWERERFGRDHADVGACLLQAWQLPDDIVAAVRHHHSSDVDDGQALTALLSLSEVLCQALDLPEDPPYRIHPLPAPARRLLGEGWLTDLPHWLARIEAHFQFELKSLEALLPRA